MSKRTYRFTYRMETFIQAPDESAARDLFGACDLGKQPTEYLELVDVEEYDEPFGTPVEEGLDE